MRVWAGFVPSEPTRIHIAHTILVYGDSSLPGTGPLSTFFRHFRGKVKA